MARIGPFSDPEHITVDPAPPLWSDPAHVNTVAPPRPKSWSNPVHVSTWVVDPHLEWFVWDGVALREVEPLGVRS